MNYRSCDVSFTINGETFFDDGNWLISWNYQPKPPPFAPRFLFGPETYECSITVPMKRRTWKLLVRAVLRPRRLHASFETLMRRASYGGRKGRRAMRRLLAMSDATWRSELGSRP